MGWRHFTGQTHHRGDFWEAHTCELPDRHEWSWFQRGQLIECEICGRVRQYIDEIIGWIEWIEEGPSC